MTNDAAERSIKDRIGVVAHEKQLPFNTVWQMLVLERFLARLARSKYRNQFIFKGGMLLSYYHSLGRETTDLDFLYRQAKGELASIKSALAEIINLNLDDGFTFELFNVSEVDHIQTPYPGYAVEIFAKCGATKTKIFWISASAMLSSVKI